MRRSSHHSLAPRAAAQGDWEDFQCRRCGRCCTGEGYVNVEPEECRRIAEFLGMDEEAFLARYTRADADLGLCLTDGPGDDEPCVFLDRAADGLASCRLQGTAKPRQCREFPLRWRRAGFENWCAGFKG